MESNRGRPKVKGLTELDYLISKIVKDEPGLIKSEIHRRLQAKGGICQFVTLKTLYSHLDKLRDEGCIFYKRGIGNSYQVYPTNDIYYIIYFSFIKECWELIRVDHPATDEGLDFLMNYQLFSGLLFNKLAEEKIKLDEKSGYSIFLKYLYHALKDKETKEEIYRGLNIMKKAVNDYVLKKEGLEGQIIQD